MVDREGYQQTEVGMIPEDWDEITLGEITNLMTNGFVGTATTHYTNAHNGVTYIQGFNVEENSFNFTGIKKIDYAFHKSHQKSCLREGDLLTVQTGDVGLTTIVPKELEGSNCHALIISRFKQKKASPWFYAQYFNSFIGRNRLKELEIGTTMKHLNVGDMLNWKVPLPPTLAEQKAIATALSDVDSLISNLEKLIAKKKAIKQGAMQQLLTGKKRLPGFSGEWEELKLGTLCEFTQGVQIAQSEQLRSTRKGYIRYLYIRDFFTDDFKWYVKDIYPNKIMSSTDIMMVNTGNTAGDVYSGAEGVLSNNAFKIDFDSEKLNRDYLFLNLRSSFAIRQIKEIFNSSGQPHVGHKNIAKINIPIPHSMEEQEAIADTLSDMDKEIEALENKKAKCQQIKQGMMQELLTGKTRLI
ncbi:restriction endonuclease subunit S [Labilibaculum sp. DW002]|uniref:Restriction endonuclease subunit S n=1 Tax=Paralabilibaculum antarcticum TaxID=2912572 RepID=A0ABT5VSS8_9BACT|nr:restriction endonuclease subunit S [Labilibaculum sp. DW002]MDE5418477.1 restriction endonuclease subunit S [Labilibaculum sp. DW002]